MPWPSEARRPIERRTPLSGGLPRQALALILLRRPAGAAAPLGAIAFAFAAASVFALHCGLDYALAEPPRTFLTWAVAGNALFVLLALVLGTFAARLLQRPALILRMAALMLLATLPAQLLLRGSLHADATNILDTAWAAPLVLAHSAVAMLRLLGWVGGRIDVRAWIGTPILLSAAIACLQALPPMPLWWTDSSEEDEYLSEEAEPAFDPESLLYAQPDAVDRALAQLAPQRPDAIDLYAVGFGGDGAESVFRNEVEYFSALMAQRFGAQGRTLQLINHPDTVDRDPIATLHNLRRALAGIGERIDREQDIVLLFLTSHGSAEHELYVSLEPLPLHQITPDDLRAALDAAGIRWRVLIVSACYSGGFIDALQSPDALVMTAARADRPSFGCGVQSEVTWFGQALLTEALNETADFAAAFDIAKRNVRRRERDEGEEPSHPQLRAGEAIAAQLQRWREQTTFGAAVPFAPAKAAVPD